ncbi:MAG: N-acetylmuramoyl-L-alanine amidase, partial [Deltaproteobacteria bacterium]|nr:N-acetylmuramoyl-L-alanine amidase [Deltaproteobacteria bacterium]
MMPLRARSVMNEFAIACLLSAPLLMPAVVFAQRQPSAGDSEAAPPVVDPEQRVAPLPGDRIQVTGVRFLSSKAYTRVMLDLSQQAKFEIRRLKEDAAKGTPARIYIDIAAASLALTSKEPVPVEDGLLKQIRIGQYTPDVVRVVLDMQSLRDHKAFILPDPYRLVVDVQGQKAAETSAVKESRAKKVPTARKSQAKEKKPAPTASLTPGIRKIVLDPGHGGKDPGAIGIGGVAEKDIVLSIAKKLAVKLRKEMGVQVVLTRTDDRHLRLEDRTYRANAEEADLFISLHMNASDNAEAKGIETYYLDTTTDEAAMRLAARENGMPRHKISDLQFILADLTQNMKLEDSITLAHRLQASSVAGMTKVMSDVKDLGVK